MKNPVLSLSAIALLVLSWATPALAEGALEWSEPLNVSQSLHECVGPVVAGGTDGRTHVVWQEDGSLAHAVRENGSWSEPSAFYVGDSPEVCMEGAVVHLVWVETIEEVQEVQYASWTEGEWAPPVTVSHTDGDSASPAVAVTSSGEVHVVWSDDTPGYSSIYHAYSSDNGALWTVGPIPYAAGQAPSLTAGSSGVLHAAWHDRLFAGDPNHIYHSEWNGTQWSWPVDVSDSPGDASFAHILVDDQDSVHLAWGEVLAGVSSVRHCIMPSGQFWSWPFDVSPGGVDAWGPRLSLGTHGEVAVVWNEADALAYSLWQPSVSVWSQRSVIADGRSDCNEAALAGSVEDGLQAVWTEESATGRDVYFSRGTAPEKPVMYVYLPMVCRP